MVEELIPDSQNSQWLIAVSGHGHVGRRDIRCDRLFRSRFSQGDAEREKGQGADEILKKISCRRMDAIDSPSELLFNTWSSPFAFDP